MPTDALRDLPFMGVIRVNEEAMKVGFSLGDSSWSNLGQGQPEVGDLPGAPPRINSIDMEPMDHAYGPVEGTPELREAVAEHYNRLYRRGSASKYTAENVVISAGGRTGLSRTAAALDDVRLGFFTPDYTAYEDLLSTFTRVEPVRIELQPDDGFRMSPSDVETRVDRDRLGALLISNPCNPTGVVMRGDELASWIEMARRRSCLLLLDEFYSHYVYAADHDGPVSAAAFIEDVDRDPVILFDGLTKCLRYPGWRVGWMVAPKSVARKLTAAGSFLDGGPPRPIQRAAIEVLEPSRADQETAVVRRVFADKQRTTLDALRSMGVTFPHEHEGTFYVYGSIADLPAPINNGPGFMRAGFEHRVLTVPGEYFDVDPHRRRAGPSRLRQFVRFSFGPPRDNLEAGLGRLAEMVAASRQPQAVSS